jgi:hypothetical protein
MLSISSLENSKIHILKTTVILLIVHLYKCYIGYDKCGNVDILTNILGIFIGFIIFNYVLEKIIKLIYIKPKFYKIIKNTIMYMSVLLIHNIFVNSFYYLNVNMNNYYFIILIMTILNLVNFFNNQRLDEHKKIDYFTSFLNSINTTIFIILVDSLVYDNNSVDYFKNNLGKNMIGYIMGFIIYLLIKKRLFNHYV